ncbi:MAG: ComEC/Rec2 family competence protein [Eubacterium sp.]|nr:ComEC/Rec2 family competence protein [Eubacterium sp.]
MKRIFAHIGFSVAVTLLAVNLINIRFLPLVLAGLAALLTVSLLLPELRRALTAPLCLSAAVFACLIYLTAYQAAAAPALALDGRTADTTLHIVSLPEERNGKYYYTVAMDTVEVDGAPQGIKALLIAEDPVPADAYQYVEANVSFRKTGETAFASYGYWGKGIFLRAEVNTCHVTHQYQPTPMRRVLHLRRDMIELFKVAIPGDAGALAAALITGDRSALSDEAYAAFSSTGMSHLMAVSGLHLTVVVGIVYFLLRRIGINRRSVAVTALLAMLFYMALTGFSKSVIRAGVMTAVLLLGQLGERKGEALNSLGLAAFVICLNPFAVSDLSAVLSTLCVLALTTLYPMIMKLAERYLPLQQRHVSLWKILLIKLLKAIVTSVAASFSVLLYTLPAMVLFFGWTTLTAIVGNLLLMPLGSADVGVSMLTYLANKLHVAAPVFNTVCRLLNELILHIVFFLSEHGIAFTLGKYCCLSLGAVLLLFSLCFMLHRHDFMRKAAAFSAVLLVLTLAAEGLLYQSEDHVLLRQSGAGALVSQGEAVVWNVNSRSDYYAVCDFLKANGNKLELLLCNGEQNEWNERLTAVYHCQTVVAADASGGDVSSMKGELLVLSDRYDAAVGDHVKVDCCYGERYYYINFQLADSTLTVGKNITADADITAVGKKVFDRNGTVDLRDGDVIYDIRNGNYYTARRVEAWQS